MESGMSRPPFVLDVSNPEESRSFDYVSIGKLLDAGLIEPLGAGYYVVTDEHTMFDVRKHLVPPTERTYRVWVLDEDAREIVFKGSPIACGPVNTVATVIARQADIFIGAYRG